jgi:hypothetical protein
MCVIDTDLQILCHTGCTSEICPDLSSCNICYSVSFLSPCRGWKRGREIDQAINATPIINAFTDYAR